ncbi:MAG: tetratricopeptide repeat protein, partial [Candidatus Eisenbacteria bacterium]|nr:tetratricopeptide repeat protein [Candidatus Eisenbacteria bacterium]
AELYELLEDPGETENRIARESAIAQRLRARLQKRLSESEPANDARAVVDDGARARLQSLGYVGNRPVRAGRADEDAPDAKRLIAFHEQFQETLGRLTAGDFTEARTRSAQMLSAHPEIADVWILRGDIEVAAGRNAEAIPHYQKYLEETRALGPTADAGRLRAQYNLANALAAVGETQQALTAYRAALEIDPQHINARYNLGLTLGESGALDAAIAELERVIELDPGFPEGHYDLGYAFALRGDAAAAERHYNEALRRRPDYAQASLRLGDLLAARGGAAAALAHYERVLDLHPELPEAYMKTARAHLSGGDQQAAVEIYHRALNRFPQWNAAAVELAWILATSAEPSVRNGRQALSLARGACAHLSDPNPRCLDTLAAAYAATGNFEQAISVLERALEFVRQRGQGGRLQRILQSHLAAYRHGQPLFLES